MQAASYVQAAPISQGQPQGIPNKPRVNPAAAPSVSYTPTDTTIPINLYDKIPNLELYKKLKDAEHNINLTVSRKALDFQAIQQKAIYLSNFSKETGILRVFIYNTSENQPWQKQLLQEQGHTIDPSEESTWTLKVEGKFISNNENIDTKDLKLSTLLSGLSIDLIPTADYPNLQDSLANLVEWRDEAALQTQNPNRQSVFDGLEIKRAGIFNIKSKIALMVKNQSNSLRLSDEMAQFTGKLEATQQELTYIVWKYVLYKDLFKKKDSFAEVPAVSTNEIINENGVGQEKEDSSLTVVQCDELLGSLLKTETFKFSNLYKLLQPHFKPREPVIIEYEINTRKSTTLGEVVLDIPIDLPFSVSSIQKELTELNKSTFENLSKYDSIIHNLSSRISLGIVALQNASLREKFYKELNEDPVKFIERWFESQLETLKALKSDEGYDEEIVRRAEYFEKNEDMLKDKIDLLLGSARI